jgi:anion-transporting  ArsA/GET3 family ATPase
MAINESSLAEKIADKRLVVLVGSGGVGKTTTSAALALAAAQGGRKVLVLTIDPARRLASSLGLSELDNTPRRIDPQLFAAQGLPMAGELWAMMLDTKRTFDEVVTRYAPRPEIARTILGNLVYQQISDALAGTQEYMAMEQIYTLTRANEFDLIVLDTPPTQHALDFLDSPDRMMHVLDVGVVQKVFGGAMEVGSSYVRWVKKSTELVAGLFERITGNDLFRDMSEFFQAFDELYAGFRARSHEVKLLLQSDATVFFLVTGPMASHVQEAAYFLGKIDSYGMNLGGFIINRVHQLPSPGALEVDEKSLVMALRKAVGTAAAEEQVLSLAQDLFSAWKRYGALVAQDQMQIARLSSRAGVLIKQVPYFDSDIHDLSGLNRLNQFLMGFNG